MKRTILALYLVLLTGTARAHPPVDETQNGGCLEFKVDGKPTPCNHDFRLVDDGRGEVTFVTAFGDGKAKPKTVVAFFTAQSPEMENAYGYALRVTNVTLMTDHAPASQRMWRATGLCFMVKPNPVGVGAQAIRQDIVVLCTAHLADTSAGMGRIDWKFVY